MTSLWGKPRSPQPRVSSQDHPGPARLRAPALGSVSGVARRAGPPGLTLKLGLRGPQADSSSRFYSFSTTDTLLTFKENGQSC